MRYYRQLNYRNRKRFLLKVKLFAAILIATGLIIAGVIYYSLTLQEEDSIENPPTSQSSNVSYASSVKVFKSPYFQLQLNNDWAEVPAESSPTKFVYRSFRSNLVEHELVIYVNTIPQDLSSNRVLPVNLKGDSELLPITVSQHCLQTLGAPKFNNPEVVLDKVKFRCDADSTDYSVLVGLVDGTSTLSLKRPDGTSANYAMRYSNLKATPDGNVLTQVAESFQTR